MHILSRTDGNEVVDAVKNYASQYAAAKSLPFTAAQMALDCVSASFSTVFGNVPPNPKVIAKLMAEGHKEEAKALRKIMFVTEHVDVGGRNKRKAETDVGGQKKRTAKSAKDKPRSKRSRFRLHRTNVVKRIAKMADKVLQEKIKFLLGCKYVGIILDEGNNYKRSCPLYVAVIACDSEFNWRIMFIGQGDTAGKKDGASIHKLVRKIFVDTGMLEVYKKICSGGTDGASVMRSSSEYDGTYFFINIIYYYNMCQVRV